ncbi:MAG TPA: hypothetical protein VMP86_02510 [Candidatus Binatia bacterium]|nr:hypothetical protein [Candidatus Binatia bacterium]
MGRINVVGTSCSGKTTLARALANRLDLPFIEFDALFWGPDWTPVPEPVFRERLAVALTGEAWVADGAYSQHRDITWARVETVVWLDYPMPLVLGRWARRTLARIRSQEAFWPGTGNASRSPTPCAAAGCSGGSSERTVAAGAGLWPTWPRIPPSGSSGSARRPRRNDGSGRSRDDDAAQ